MKKLKIGLDIHGVCDARPEVFSVLSKLLVEAGHEVHILTGPKITQKIHDELKSYGIHYTHIFSIADHNEQAGVDIKWDDKGNPHMDPYAWDKTKGEYCAKHGIDLHFDDSDAYGYFFKTPYARVYAKDSERVRKIKI